MAAYVISYDLNKPGQNYNQLYEAIKRNCPTHWRCLDSTWIVDYSNGATQLRDNLTPYIDSNDKLLVARLSNEAAWYGFNTNGSAWLKNLIERQLA